MADSTTTTTSTEVTVMSADQVTQLITAITGSLTELKTAVVTELASIKTSIDGVKTQLQTSTSNLSTAIGSVKTQIETSANAIASKIDESNTKLESLKTTITSHGTTVADSVDGLADGISDISSNLKVDVTTNTLNLEHDTKTGVKSLAYIEASAHALNLKRIKEAEDEMNGSSTDESGSGSSGDSGSESEPNTSSVIDDVQDNAAEVFGELVGYEFNVTEDERIIFKTPTDFEESRIGLAFDYTRYFYENAVDVVDNTEVKEYALLVFESYMKTSGDLGSTAIQRMKTWVDLKLIQTVVFIKDTESGKVVVYFPTQDKFDALDTEIYKNEKAAQDAVVKKYQGIIDDQYKGIAFIPVDTIEPGITLEEYRTAAKNITPTCEYT